MAKAVNTITACIFTVLSKDIFDFLFIFRFQTADFRLFFRQSHADSVRLDFIFFSFRTRLFQFAGVVLSRQQQGLRLVFFHLVDDRLLLRKRRLIALMVRHRQTRADKCDDGNRLPVIRQQFHEFRIHSRPPAV